MGLQGRLGRIQEFLEWIPDEDIEQGKFFTTDGNIWDNGEFHIDSRTVTVGHDQEHRKKGDVYWKVELQQCASKDQRAQSKKKAPSAKQNNRKQGGQVPTRKSGAGITYGIVLVHDKLKAKAPNALAFKTAMLHSCREANGTNKGVSGWVAETHNVLMQEDRSWLDEKAGFRHQESEYIGKNTSEPELPEHTEEPEDSKDSNKKNNKGGKNNKKK